MQTCLDEEHGGDFQQDGGVVTCGHELPRRADPDGGTTSAFESTEAAIAGDNVSTGQSDESTSQVRCRSPLHTPNFSNELQKQKRHQQRDRPQMQTAVPLKLKRTSTAAERSTQQSAKVEESSGKAQRPLKGRMLTETEAQTSAIPAATAAQCRCVQADGWRHSLQGRPTSSPQKLFELGCAKTSQMQTTTTAHDDRQQRARPRKQCTQELAL